MSRQGVYVWSDLDFAEYLRKEKNRLKELGFGELTYRHVTKLINERIIQPNDIRLTDLIKPKLKVRRRRTR